MINITKTLAPWHLKTGSSTTTKSTLKLLATLTPYPPKSSLRPWIISTNNVINAGGTRGNLGTMKTLRNLLAVTLSCFTTTSGWRRFPICKTWLFHSCHLVSSETQQANQVRVLLMTVIPAVANEFNLHMKARVENLRQLLQWPFPALTRKKKWTFCGRRRNRLES